MRICNCSNPYEECCGARDKFSGGWKYTTPVTSGYAYVESNRPKILKEIQKLRKHLDELEALVDKEYSDPFQWSPSPTVTTVDSSSVTSGSTPMDWTILYGYE